MIIVSIIPFQSGGLRITLNGNFAICSVLFMGQGHWFVTLFCQTQLLKTISLLPAALGKLMKDFRFHTSDLTNQVNSLFKTFQWFSYHRLQGSMSGLWLLRWPHLLALSDSSNLFWFSCLVVDV